MTDEPTPTLDDLVRQGRRRVQDAQGTERIQRRIPVIEDSKQDRQTLVVHIARDDADSLADQIEEFLRQQGAHTERETHTLKSTCVS